MREDKNLNWYVRRAGMWDSNVINISEAVDPLRGMELGGGLQKET